MKHFFVFLFAATVFAQDEAWTYSTALPLRAHRFEIGVFGPLRYGWGKGVELATYPLLNALMPNLAVKKTWTQRSWTCIATEHSLSYPTPLLKTLAREGAGGIFPADSRIPHFVSSRHSILLTRSLDRNSHVTALGEISLAARMGEFDMPTLDYPIVYPRMSHYYQKGAIRFGLDFSNAIYENWILHSDVDLFLLLDPSTPFAYEHKSLLLWYGGEKMRILGGYKLVYGTYPFGTQVDAFPLIDVEWGIR